MPLEKLEKAILRGETSRKELNSLVKNALDNHKMKAVVSLLEPHLKHDNPNVRLAAIEALKKTDSNKIVSLVKPLVKDANERVRLKAKETLERIKAKEDDEII